MLPAPRPPQAEQGAIHARLSGAGQLQMIKTDGQQARCWISCTSGVQCACSPGLLRCESEVMAHAAAAAEKRES